MKPRLKQFRVEAGLTQAKLAEAVGVTQPNYQRWEAGAAPVPQAKLKKLASVLKTSPEAIQGKHAPIETSLYDDSVSDELSYYGEVAIHFCGGGKPLLLTISEDAFARLHRDLQGQATFVSVESLANQTLAIRTGAIADVYFSSEAYDNFGPEDDSYDDRVSLQLSDPRDWEIIESLAFDEVGIEDFDPTQVERIRQQIMITDEQYDKLVADGRIKAEDLEIERARNRVVTDRIFNLASMTTYQLSTGRRRTVYVDDRQALFRAFWEVVDQNDGTVDDMIRLEAEGRHRIIFINKGALDYVSVPTHQLDDGRVEVDAVALED